MEQGNDGMGCLPCPAFLRRLARRMDFTSDFVRNDVRIAVRKIENAINPLFCYHCENLAWKSCKVVVRMTVTDLTIKQEREDRSN